MYWGRVTVQKKDEAEKERSHLTEAISPTLSHHCENADRSFARLFIFCGRHYDQRPGCGQGGEGSGFFYHVASMKGELPRQGSIGTQIHRRFCGKTDGVARFHEKLRCVSSDRKRLKWYGRRFGDWEINCQVGAADSHNCALWNHSVLRFPSSDIVERNLRWGVRCRVQIQHYERSDETLRRNLASSPSSGNECPGRDDAGLGF